MRKLSNRVWGLLAFVIAVFAIAATGQPLAGLPLVGVIGDTTTTADMEAAMKVIFEDAIVNNVVTDAELLDQFEDGGGIKTDTTTGGRYIETAQMFALPAGVGARSEGDYIPIPRGPVVENSRVNLKKILGSVEMTAETLKMVRTNEGAFIEWADRALPSLVERLTNEIDRILLGYGAGVKARVNAAVPAVNLVVDSPMGIAGLPGALLQFLANETLVAGPNIDGTGLRAGVMVVQNVDWANGYITVDALPAGLADNDYLFPGDASGNSVGKEPMGLFGMVDDGGILATFQNIARATYSAWQSTIIDAQSAPFAAGQTLTEKVIWYTDDQVFTRGGGKPDLFLCSRQGARQYWSDLVGDRQLNDPRAFTGGQSGLSVMLGDRTIPLKVARKIPDTVAFLLTRSTFRKWMLHNFQWDDTSGSLWKQVTDGTGRKDAFWAYGSLYAEFGNQDPQKNARIENLANTAF